MLSCPARWQALTWLIPTAAPTQTGCKLAEDVPKKSAAIDKAPQRKLNPFRSCYEHWNNVDESCKEAYHADKDKTDVVLYLEISHEVAHAHEECEKNECGILICYLEPDCASRF